MSTDPHGWIQTYTGKKFHPLDPDPAAICIEDIAHALSMQCRFTGHVKRFYSVAEHSVHVARQVLVASPRDAFWALMHDASEAYLLDLAKPVKRLPELAAYRDAEARVMRAICEAFDLPAEEPKPVKPADVRMLATEAAQLMAPLHRDWHQSCEPYPGLVLACWAPEQAEREFLEMFRAFDAERVP